MPVLTLQRVPSTPLIWFTVGFALASLAGVLLDGAVWLAVVGLACVSIGFLLRGLGRWPRLRRLLAGAGIALVWLVVYGAVFVSPAQAMENRTVAAGCRRHPLAGAHRLRCPRDPPGRGGGGP